MEQKTIKTAILALTPSGRETGVLLAKALQGELFLPDKLHSQEVVAHYYAPPFSQMLSQLFYKAERIVFVMATGIVVRSIAPLLQHKSQDPAVVVVDERLQFAISLVSGHVGGANALALEIETATGATAVITTATDVNHLFAADVLAKELGCFSIGQMKLYKELNTAFLWKKPIAIVDECGVFPQKAPPEENQEAWRVSAKEEASNIGGFTESYFLRGAWIFSSKAFFLEDPREFSFIISLSYQQNPDINFKNKVAQDHFLQLIPKNLVLGAGCRKDIQSSLFEEQALLFLEKHKLAWEGVGALCSIELKKNESAIQALGEKWNIPFQCFSAEEIQSIIHEIPNLKTSDFVQRQAGVPAVAHPCAYISSGGNILIARESGVATTFALGQKPFYYREGHFSFQPISGKEGDL